MIGGTNVQWAHDPKTDRDIIIEINPRTSRSSALASKATGFPIALVSAMLATGMTLDEIPCGKYGTLDKYVPDGGLCGNQICQMGLREIQRGTGTNWVRRCVLWVKS